MAIQRWVPFAHMNRMDREVDRMWPHLFRPLQQLPRYWDVDSTAPLDMYYTDGMLVVEVTAPEFKPEAVELTITGTELNIKGEVKAETQGQEGPEQHYLVRERRVASFNRTVSLPKGLETQKATASYENGVLTVTIPRSEEAKPKQVKIEVKTPAALKS